MKCDDIKRSLESGERLSGDEGEHLKDCAECAESAARETRLTALLRELPRAAAPASFDAVLRRKIESRKQGAGASRSFRPGILVPAAAALLAVASLAALIILYPTFGNLETADVPPPEISPPPVIRPDAPDTPAGPVAGNTAEDDGTEPPNPDKPAAQPAERDKTRPDVSGGGSLDLATTEAKRTTPPWLAPDVPVNSRPNITERKFTPAEILSELGIESVYTDAGWKVVSVAGGGIAARSGVESGDLIKALDGNALGSSPIRGGSISGRTLEVERDGKRVTLQIRP